MIPFYYLVSYISSQGFLMSGILPIILNIAVFSVYNFLEHISQYKTWLNAHLHSSLYFPSNHSLLFSTEDLTETRGCLILFCFLIAWPASIGVYWDNKRSETWNDTTYSKGLKKDTKYVTRIESNLDHPPENSIPITKASRQTKQDRTSLGYRTTINQDNILAIQKLVRYLLTLKSPSTLIVPLFISHHHQPPKTKQNTTQLGSFQFPSFRAYLFRKL